MTLTIHDVEQRSDEWYALRRGIITASTVGNLLTIGRLGPDSYDCPSCSANAGDPCISRARKEPAEIKTYHPERTAAAAAASDDEALVISVAHNDTAQALTRRLVAERITDRSDDTYQTRDMLRGVLDEPYARAVYSEYYAPVTECGFMTLDRGEWRLGYSPDGLVGDDGLIEIKSRKPHIQLGTVLDGVVPVEYMAQIQAGLLVSGRQWCDFVSYSGGMHLWTTRVYPDPRWFTAIDEAMGDFSQAAAAMRRTYKAATRDLPLTEYIDHFAEIEV